MDGIQGPGIPDKAALHSPGTQGMTREPGLRPELLAPVACVFLLLGVNCIWQPPRTQKGVTESTSFGGLSILVSGRASGPPQILYTPPRDI